LIYYQKTMKFAYIGSLLLCLFTTVASVCKVKLGVEADADGCSAAIQDVITEYGLVAYEAQCQANRRRGLKGTNANEENDERELYCPPQHYCNSDPDPDEYYCYYACGGRRDLEEKSKNVDDRRLEVWSECTFPFDAFRAARAVDIDNDATNDEATKNCWTSLWCMTNQP
jgi:hypothetical protein